MGSAAFQEQPLVQGLRRAQPAFVAGPVVGAMFHVGRRSGGGGSNQWGWGLLGAEGKDLGSFQKPKGDCEGAAFLPWVGVSFLLKDLAKSGGAWKHFFWASVEGQSLPGAPSGYGGSRPASVHSAAGKELWWVPKCPLSLPVALPAIGLACPLAGILSVLGALLCPWCWPLCAV